MPRIRFALFLAVLTLGLAPLPRDSYDGGTRLRVRLPHSLATAKFVTRTGFIHDHKRDAQFSYGYLGTEALEALPRETRDAVTILGQDVPVSRDLYEGYHNYEALTQELKAIRDAYPGLARLETAGKSVQGRELWYLVISDNVTEDEPEPKLLYLANMHGDETVGRELMIYLSRLLLSQHGRDGKLTELVDNAQIFIMPSMNPDGFELGRRWNARGKDLNRNFPDLVSDPLDDPKGREVEVQHVMALNDRHHFVTGINWHGGEICFNLPWGNIKNDKPEKLFGDDPFLAKVGREYADLNLPMKANHDGNFVHGVTYGYEWYPINGGIQDYHDHFRRSIMATVELSVVKWPGAKELPKFWDDNRDAMLGFLYRSMEGVHLRVIDTDGNPVRGVRVGVSSAPRRKVRYDTELIHKPTVPGTQTVVLEATGFKTAKLTMEPTIFSGNYANVVLERSGAILP